MAQRQESPWPPDSESGSPPPAAIPTREVALLGLADSCWRCKSESVALIGMIEVGGDLFSEELVLCDSDERLALAWQYLPTEARARWKVGEVAYRTSKTAQATYLANGCAVCGGLRGAHPLFHEAVPEALAVHGTDAFITLAVVDMPSLLFDEAFESRWE